MATCKKADHNGVCKVLSPAGMQVMFEGILLKPSMVTPGADSSKREKPEVVADYTLKLLRRRVPPAVPGEPLSVVHALQHCTPWHAVVISAFGRTQAV